MKSIHIQSYHWQHNSKKWRHVHSQILANLWALRSGLEALHFWASISFSDVPSPVFERSSCRRAKTFPHVIFPWPIIWKSMPFWWPFLVEWSSCLTVTGFQFHQAVRGKSVSKQKFCSENETACGVCSAITPWCFELANFPRLLSWWTRQAKRLGSAVSSPGAVQALSPAKTWGIWRSAGGD